MKSYTHTQLRSSQIELQKQIVEKLIQADVSQFIFKRKLDQLSKEIYDIDIRIQQFKQT